VRIRDDASPEWGSEMVTVPMPGAEADLEKQNMTLQMQVWDDGGGTRRRGVPMGNVVLSGSALNGLSQAHTQARLTPYTPDGAAEAEENAGADGGGAAEEDVWGLGAAAMDEEGGKGQAQVQGTLLFRFTTTGYRMVRAAELAKIKQWAERAKVSVRRASINGSASTLQAGFMQVPTPIPLL
jgi:hypothetical protein